MGARMTVLPHITNGQAALSAIIVFLIVAIAAAAHRN
jgi:hypothetical protein